MKNLILLPDQLQSGLKPDIHEYHIDTRTGRAIVLLPTSKNQERPSVDVAIGCTVTINDLFGCFDATVEIRAPKGGTVDGGSSITVSENNANVKFTLVDELTWVSNTLFNRSSEEVDITANVPYEKVICNLNFLSLYDFDLTFHTKYKIESINLKVTDKCEYEISHIGEDLIEYETAFKDGKYIMSIVSKFDGKLFITPNSLLRK
jgi:hypothetical protein